MSDDRARLDWIESQSSGRGWNVGRRTEGWPLAIVPRGPFATLRQAIDRAMDADADEQCERGNVLEQRRDALCESFHKADA